MATRVIKLREAEEPAPETVQEVLSQSKRPEVGRFLLQVDSPDQDDGFRLMARRDPVGIRLITRRGNDWTNRYPLVAKAVNQVNCGAA